MGSIDPKLAEVVRARSENTCEYCLLPQSIRLLRFQIEHVIPRKHGGVDALENLALACGRCNRHKGTNIAGLDPLTGKLTRLFHPRQDRWSDHFAMNGPRIIGRTDIGRVTLAVLNMNHPEEINVRAELLAGGYFLPPRTRNH